MSDQKETPQEENLETIPEQEVPSAAPQEPCAEEMMASLKDQLLRQMAETENLRKRAERERDETARYAVTKLARDLLDVADNLGRAVSAIEAGQETLSPGVQTFVEGVKMTQSALESTFERHKIQKINPKGEPFDHNFHQAMFEVPTGDHVPGTVMEVLQPGYVLHDRLLRPAMVGVAKALETTA
jgi:molecular chaperone GrpE